MVKGVCLFLVDVHHFRNGFRVDVCLRAIDVLLELTLMKIDVSGKVVVLMEKYGIRLYHSVYVQDLHFGMVDSV